MPALQVPSFEKDVVYLFQFPGTATASSLSPYCVKVEAFCRLHNLKFERRNTTSARGANGLLPFIELNGVATCESQVIWKRLTEHFQLKTFPDPHSEGIGHAIERMIENHTLHLLRFDSSRTLGPLIRAVMKERVPGFTLSAVASSGSFYMRRKARISSDLRTAIGNFNDSEYDEMLRKDLIHLQNVLDGKQFLMGDSPNEVDCMALAHIGHAYYRMPQARSHIHELLDSTELGPLKEYFDRVVKTLFRDDFKV